MATPLDARERAALCDLFDELGPDAPTLCEGWTTADLAAHLVVRERDPRSGPGIVLGGRFEQYTNKLMERAKAKGYAALVQKVRSGPPPGPFKVPRVRDLLNLSEYFIHFEDVRRANGRGPRTRDEVGEVEDRLWQLTKRGARLQVRKVPKEFGVTLSTPDGDSIVARQGDRAATITGRPGEITLFLSGRGEAADVELTGDAEAIAALRSSQLGL